jgi:glucose/arabinose dehydrogenase
MAALFRLKTKQQRAREGIMKKRFLVGAALLSILTGASQIATAQQPRELRPIQGNYYDTATIKPTVERIKTLKLPAGFQIAKFAEITNPRILAVAPDGTIYVSQREPGTLTMLKDTNGDGAADIQKVVAEKKQLHGVFIDAGKLYFTTVKEVFVTDIKPDGTLSEPRMIISDLPDAGQHPNRTIAVRDGKLYITVGSTCNACDESTPEAATILEQYYLPHQLSPTGDAADYDARRYFL